jgi:predicted small metal-binding protein
MKGFKCAAVVSHCPTVFHGESEDAILGLIEAHARDMHGMYQVPPEVVDEIRANILELSPA